MAGAFIVTGALTMGDMVPGALATRIVPEGEKEGVGQVERCPGWLKIPRPMAFATACRRLRTPSF
jgi:hypothetical protein